MAEIKFRVRGGGWVETVSATPDWTIKKLLDFLKEKHGEEASQLKYGWPLKAIDLSNADATIEPLNLKGETVTFVPKEDPAAAAAAAAPPPKEVFKPKPVQGDETTLHWPEKEGYLVLRVMADDNSCMFTAFGGVIPLADPARILRREVADYILSHPDKYDKVVLEMEPERYCRLIRTSNRWGGAIELSILSDIYNMEICSIDVKTQRVDRYGEGKDLRCLLLYSGIHYDRIAFAMQLGFPVEVDEVKWSTDNDGVVEMARKLAKQLKDKHYFTDTTDFVLKCDVPNCGWIGQGQKNALKHSQETGHMALSEMQIT